jgi:CubicO group peptidase (beta-lactamase class C family)
MWKALLAAPLLAVMLAAQADEGLQAFLRQTLVEARDKHGVPAIAALVMRDGQVVAEAAVGVRAVRHPEPVTIHDRWHLGSDTKAFTSTMIARLVERGIMAFDDTMAASFPALAGEIDPAYRNVTVRQLLGHTAGLPPLTSPTELPAFYRAIGDRKDVRAQRAAVARKYLSMPPASKAGEFAYSNLGYVIAAAIAESKTGKSWEDLVRDEVFVPVGIRNAGFGAPGLGGIVDEPWGHADMRLALMPLDPSQPGSDNPPAMGPAGRINITLRDWARFAQDQLDGELGQGKLLKPETYRLLHTPVADHYALGWGVLLDAHGARSLLSHLGSNGHWLAQIRISPRERWVELIAMNAANKDANEAMDEVTRSLRDARWR